MGASDAAYIVVRLYGVRAKPSHPTVAPSTRQRTALPFSHSTRLVLGMSDQYTSGRHAELSVLNEALTAHRIVVESMPDDDPDLPTYLTELGDRFESRFALLREPADIEEAIAAYRRALELTPDGHAGQAAYLGTLGTCLHRRFKRLGDLSDISEAIIWESCALELIPDGDPNKPVCLNNLGNSLLTRFKHLGERRDIEQAILAQRRAVELIPDGHPSKPRYFSDLGNSLKAHFERLGELSDIEQAIAAHRRAVELTPDGHSNKPARFNNLGTSLLTRFERLGELSDIEQSIVVKRRAVELTPDGHPDKPSRFNNLGNSSQTRFERLGELNDIEQAIAAKRRAVELTPDGHPNKPVLFNNLGNSFWARFERLGELNNIEQAIAAQRRAVELTPDGHPEKPLRFNNLGTSLRTRFERLGELSDIEQSIAAKRRAVELTPDGHPDKPARFSNLGNSLQTRFERLGEFSDIEQAIAVKCRAVELTPDGHPDKAGHLINLGSSFKARLGLSLSQSDFMLAVKAFSDAAHAIASPSVMLRAAMWCTNLFSRYPAFVESPEDVLPVHARVLELIPEAVWLGHNISRRYEEVARIGSAASAATAAALSTEDKSLALQWFEEGRTIVWGQIQNLRTPVDYLREKHPDHADKLASVSSALENAGRRSTSAVIHETSETTRASLEDEAVTHRRLAEEYRVLLHDIRQLDGFGSFLRPKTTEELSRATFQGPVACINVHKSRCDALVLSGSQPPTLHRVPLPKFSLSHASELYKRFNLYLRHERARKRASFQVFPAEITGDGGVCAVFGSLWRSVVEPILQVVTSPQKSASSPLPQITWCTTGALAFLPLHSPSSPKAFNVVVSTYTPSLSSLLPSARATKPALEPSILVIAQPNTPDCNPLPGTEQELMNIATHFEQGSSKLLVGADGTVDEVLKHMNEHPWIHLACHGTQDILDPTQSAFLLEDGPLTLQKLMASKSSVAELAFLSACETATGDESLPSEAVHLAAGMLAVGYRSVVATTWSIGDSEAPLVADAFYQALLKERKAGERLDVAYALHEAVRKLRDEVGEDAFVKWVPFVHFGI